MRKISDQEKENALIEVFQKENNIKCVICATEIPKDRCSICGDKIPELKLIGGKLDRKNRCKKCCFICELIFKQDEHYRKIGYMPQNWDQVIIDTIYLARCDKHRVFLGEWKPYRRDYFFF